MHIRPISRDHLGWVDGDTPEILRWERDCICFIDTEEAFDNTSHEAIKRALERRGVDGTTSSGLPQDSLIISWFSEWESHSWQKKVTTILTQSKPACSKGMWALRISLSSRFYCIGLKDLMDTIPMCFHSSKLEYFLNMYEIPSTYPDFVNVGSTQ